MMPMEIPAKRSIPVWPLPEWQPQVCWLTLSVETDMMTTGTDTITITITDPVTTITGIHIVATNRSQV